jgi:DNA primase
MAFDFEEINRIRAKADIVKVISSYIDVSKKGSQYVALCPFHPDHNPSLSINPQKQIFKCFVCNTGGNVFSFVQKYEKVSFREAVKKVCEICGIEKPAFLAYEPKRVRTDEAEHRAVEKLSDFYAYMLKTNEGKPALDYLTQRGLDSDVISHFKLGYAPLDPDKSINYLRTKENIPVEVLDRAGIISASASTLSDRYRDRVMFPLSDINGDFVGFSGRKFREGNQEAKYINSPESAIFKKSTVLYNYNNAIQTIRHDRFVYVLEGFMDVIALYRAGITSAVGLMGTALTGDHLALFQRLNVEIRLCLDSDEPGQEATERALELFNGAGLNVKVVAPLNGGKDVDEILQSEGKEALLKDLNTLELPIIHSLNYFNKHGQLNTYEAKEKFLRNQRNYFNSASLLAKEDMLQELSKGLEVSPEAIRALLASYQKSNFKEAKLPVQVTELEDEDLVGKEVNNCIFAYISPRLSDERLKDRNNLMLVREESQILTRLPLDRKALELFDEAGGNFAIPAFTEIMWFLRDFYGDLPDGVEYVKEEDYDDLIGMAETYYEGNLEGGKDNSADQNAIQMAALKKTIVLGLLSRLKYCTYPSTKLDYEEFSMLLRKHRTQLLTFDLSAKSLDDKAAVSLLKRLAADRQAQKGKPGKEE